MDKAEMTRPHPCYKFGRVDTHSDENKIKLGPLADFIRGENKTELEPLADYNGGEIKAGEPYPGYANVQDLFSGAATAQSVNITAPTVGTNQDQYSGTVNNIHTNTSYFAQDGLGYANGSGFIFWASDMTIPPDSAQIFGPPYIAGHTYWFTLSFTNGAWWECVQDNANPGGTYTCHQDTGASGTQLKSDQDTSVWEENWNQGSFWYIGFSRPITAFGAAYYINGVQHQWANDEWWTKDNCTTNYPTTSALGGTLTNGGTIDFYLMHDPLYCP